MSPTKAKEMLGNVPCVLHNLYFYNTTQIGRNTTLTGENLLPKKQTRRNDVEPSIKQLVKHYISHRDFCSCPSDPPCGLRIVKIPAG